jgi:glycine oxidase
MKYVIIGNGILALSNAFQFLKKDPDAEIIVIGDFDRKGAATPAAAAMLNSFAEIDIGSLKSDASIKHYEASYLATQMWPEFERELIDYAGDHLPSECKDCQVLTGGCYSKGTYIINNAVSDSYDDANYSAILKALIDCSEPYSTIDPQLIAGYNPAPHARALRALYIPNEGWLNPKIVLNKLDNILNAAGNVTYKNTLASRIMVEGNQIKSVLCSDGSIIDGNVFILANGFDTSRLLERSSIDLGLQRIYSGVGVSIEVSSNKVKLKNVIRTPNRGGACGIYAVPYFKGPNKDKHHTIVGASNYISVEPGYRGRLISVAHLMSALVEEINQDFYDAEIVTINVGNRPTSLDQYMLIGDTPIKNLFLITGTKRDGFHLAPVLSDYLTDLILGKKPIIDLSMFNPSRALIRDISYEDGVKLNIQSLISEQYQHGFKSATIKQVDSIRSNLEREVVETHKKIGAQDWGIPPLMYKLYRDGIIK